MDLLKNFLMNNQAKYSISRPFEAEQISKFICDHLRGRGINPCNCTITDGTAGGGGDSIKFSKYFKYFIYYILKTERDLYFYKEFNNTSRRAH